MLAMNNNSLKDKAAWEKIHVALPLFDRTAVTKATMEAPVWLHFGAGNIFRGFIAVLQQRLLNEGIAGKGIIAVDSFDFDIIHKIYTPFDHLTMAVTLNGDGTTNREIVGSVVEGLCADCKDAQQMGRLREIFRAPSLQMVSYTITEKGYALQRPDGSLLPVVQEDMRTGPAAPCHAMAITCALLFERYRAGRLPLAVVSMDNCSHNGEKLRSSVLTIANAWVKNGFVPEDFVAYLEDESVVSFPWSMIDKITPRPAENVQRMLEADGVTNMAPIVTSKNTFIAPFVNAERPQYLVIEDHFPNGRPALEKAGVYMTDRDTVNRTERMKVTTCLNPLHTALSVYGCLLGYDLICEEMKDPDLTRLVKTLGYDEGLPVVVDPKIISPKAFIDEVVTERLPNPFMPDSPQRIATDTSQKVSIRFGETIKSYAANGSDLCSLKAVPLVLVGWMRYLLGVDDNLAAFALSPDPLKEELQAQLAGIEVGKPESYTGQLQSILSNASIFGVDLVAVGLSHKIEELFIKQLAGAGAVRATLREVLNS